MDDDVWFDKDNIDYRFGERELPTCNMPGGKIKAYHEIKYKLEEELVEYISKRARECNLCDSAYLSRLIKRDMGLYEKLLPGEKSQEQTKPDVPYPEDKPKTEYPVEDIEFDPEEFKLKSHNTRTREERTNEKLFLF